MRILVNEKLSDHRFKTPEGYLVCTDAILARTGKQTYRRGEVFGQDCKDADSEVEVDRTEKEVFSDATLASFENKPLTVEHPDENVNAENHNRYAVGYVRDVKRAKVDGQDVMTGTLVITDAQTIQEIEDGEHTDLSCGYDCDISDEENPQQRNIRGNHVALCQQGRAGIARIIDSINDGIVKYYNHADVGMPGNPSGKFMKEQEAIARRYGVNFRREPRLGGFWIEGEESKVRAMLSQWYEDDEIDRILKRQMIDSVKETTDIKKLASNFGGKPVPGEVYITYRFNERKSGDDFARELGKKGILYNRNSNGDVILREKNKEYIDSFDSEDKSLSQELDDTIERLKGMQDMKDDINFSNVKKKNAADKWLKQKGLYEEFLNKGLYKKYTDYEYAIMKGMPKIDDSIHDDWILPYAIWVKDKGQWKLYRASNSATVNKSDFIKLGYEDVQVLKNDGTKAKDSVKDADFDFMNKVRNYPNSKIIEALKKIGRYSRFGERFTWADLAGKLNGSEKDKLLKILSNLSDSINDVNPREGESKDDFISRFMSETKNEYPDEKQRLAVAYSYWDKNKAMKSKGKDSSRWYSVSIPGETKVHLVKATSIEDAINKISRR